MEQKRFCLSGVAKRQLESGTIFEPPKARSRLPSGGQYRPVTPFGRGSDKALTGWSTAELRAPHAEQRSRSARPGTGVASGRPSRAACSSARWPQRHQTRMAVPLRSRSARVTGLVTATAGRRRGCARTAPDANRCRNSGNWRWRAWRRSGSAGLLQRYAARASSYDFEARTPDGCAASIPIECTFILSL